MTPITYTLTVRFTVDDNSDAHLHTSQGIRDEARSWLESLRATVHSTSLVYHPPTEEHRS
jgi:hypothetical protein